ncbi:transposable element Tcb1 transposase [Trichonephila clavipes]|nr:transposable element Tcb1 transposase [Trichonephila clavipes]
MLKHRSPRVTTPNEDRYLGSYCQKKQTEHSIRPVSLALFSYRYDSFKADRVQMLRHIGLYARRPVRCFPLTATHCRLRLTWSREHALWTPQQ